MTKLKISNAEVQNLLTEKEFDYPKYATQLMNLANQNAQGTRPRVVGQMSDLIQEFDGSTLAKWEIWYKNRHPDAIQMATDRVWRMVEQLKTSLATIDRATVEQWIEELLIVKTFVGLKFQEAILKKIAEAKTEGYRLSTLTEEAQGIDGFVGNRPLSIKPVSYRSQILNEQIDVTFVFYEKKKDLNSTHLSGLSNSSQS